MKQISLILLAVVFAKSAFSLPIETEYAVSLNNTYGYTHYSEIKQKPNKQNNINSSFNFYGRLSYIHNEIYQTSVIGYLMVDSAKEIENYNQGKWGEEVYLLHENPYGEISIGQNSNVAYNFAVGAPIVGSWSADNSDIATFLTTSNWCKKGSRMSYKTLNTTYINTDGASPKISYITPQYKGMEFGISYVPQTYSQSGLVSKYSDYKDKSAYIIGAYGNWDIKGFEVETSMGFADFQDNDKEYSVGMSIYRKGWTVGGSYRLTEADKTHFSVNNILSDTYREGRAYNIGIKYEIGPFSSGIAYFDSKAKNQNNYDKIISFSNSYEYNKYTTLSFTTAHLKSGDEYNDQNKTTRGYAFILGLEFSL